MMPLKLDFAKNLDYNKIIEIQRVFEKEGSFLGSEDTGKVWRITIDRDKSKIIDKAIQNGDIIQK